MNLDQPEGVTTIDHTELYWSDELEELHEESSRTHFLDVWTRRSILERLGTLPRSPVLLDLGCSTGYLLEDLRSAHPSALLIGVDYVFSGLPTARSNVPTASLLQADACAEPLAEASVDAIVSANLLEHVPDDIGALAEIQRILRPGSRAVVVVPAGPSTYDYYDRYLRHQRRYARGELARKARSVGFEIICDIHLGSLIFPAFWAVKKRNRLMHDQLRGQDLKRRVATDIAHTKDSTIGVAACRIERWLLNHGVVVPFGVRELVVMKRPNVGPR